MTYIKPNRSYHIIRFTHDSDEPEDEVMCTLLFHKNGGLTGEDHRVLYNTIAEYLKEDGENWDFEKMIDYLKSHGITYDIMVTDTNDFYIDINNPGSGPHGKDFLGDESDDP